MLEQLLRLLLDGNIHSLGQLAQQLGVSEGLVEAMLEDLVRMGYLNEVAMGCPGDCAHCPYGSLSMKLCAVGDAGRLWTWTEKAPAGRRS